MCYVEFEHTGTVTVLSRSRHTGNRPHVRVIARVTFHIRHTQGQFRNLIRKVRASLVLIRIRSFALCRLRCIRKTVPVSPCVQAGSDPSDSSLVLCTSRESAESDPELYHIFEEKATDNIVGSIFLIPGVNS